MAYWQRYDLHKVIEWREDSIYETECVATFWHNQGENPIALREMVQGDGETYLIVTTNDAHFGKEPPKALTT